MKSLEDFAKGCGRRKPLGVVFVTTKEEPGHGQQQASDSSGRAALDRHLSLTDLLAIGIGGTVGTGIFALTGLITHQYAGSAAVLCWVIAGASCAVNGLAYMELSSRIPCAGSTYAYAYCALGELAAVVAGWCLTLEYGVSGAAVARSWSAKVVKWILSLACKGHTASTECTAFDFDHYFNYPYGNLFAGFLQLICVLVLVGGVSIGKTAVNVITVIKIVLILFMIIFGFVFFNPEYLSQGFPPMHHSDATADSPSWSGVFLGSTIAFFGFIGFDEVSCMAAEAKNPSKIMPLAVIGTIVGTTILSVLASLALTGIQRFQDIDPDAAFGFAFRSKGFEWAAQIAEIGEILTLPVVVLISFLAQPRLQFAMADDGLLPKIFGHIDSRGVLFSGTLIGGFFCVALATFVPFDHLNDLCSAGVLVSFIMANASLIMIRLLKAASGRQNEADVKISRKQVTFAQAALLLFITCSGIACMLMMKFPIATELASGVSFVVISVLALVSGLLVCNKFPSLSQRKPSSSSLPLLRSLDSNVQEGFRVPLVPVIPMVAIVIDWLLLMQLSWLGIGSIVGYVFLAFISYALYGYHSSAANTNSWHRILISNGQECFCTLCIASRNAPLFDNDAFSNHGDDEKSPLKQSIGSEKDIGQPRLNDESLAKLSPWRLHWENEVVDSPVVKKGHRV